MKPIKFITTFNSNGYHVYGQSWIESFLEFTKDFDDITAEVYVNNMDFSELDYGPKVKFINFDESLPQHKTWVDLYRHASNHGQWDRDLGIKFSYKIFVMMDSLKKHDDCYVIWLDGDSIFKSYDFNDFPINLLNDNFLACQRECGSEHVESGIIIFDAAHRDKHIFINQVELFYSSPHHFNSFGQFFDGFVIGRTLNIININYTDLNKDYGLAGIQSDPNCTFLNPELRNRFHHNIGISGKRSYQNWKIYANKDPLFQLIHGINDKSPKEKLIDDLKDINNKIKRLQRIG